MFVGLVAVNVLLIGISVVSIQDLLQGSPGDLTPLGNLFFALGTASLAFLLDGLVIFKVSEITKDSEIGDSTDR